ncbi:Protein FAR1-RELATED SEQUENCE [Abeliophyllum distichum]|uniref:Protein FAR1-RELATED SEQUENCE n=1 Tax=Abeliophyllum distichum TaxID=126358 RepID=A0ABD1R836_9LAMI
MSTGTEYECCGDGNEVMASADNFEYNEMVPTVGMKFLSDEEAFEFYRAYAYKVGFPVKRRNSKKGDDGELRYVTEGSRSSSSDMRAQALSMRESSSSSSSIVLDRTVPDSPSSHLK